MMNGIKRFFEDDCNAFLLSLVASVLITVVLTYW